MKRSLLSLWFFCCCLLVVSMCFAAWAETQSAQGKSDAARSREEILKRASALANSLDQSTTPTASTARVAPAPAPQAARPTQSAPSESASSAAFQTQPQVRRRDYESRKDREARRAKLAEELRQAQQTQIAPRPTAPPDRRSALAAQIPAETSKAMTEPAKPAEPEKTARPKAVHSAEKPAAPEKKAEAKPSKEAGKLEKPEKAAKDEKPEKAEKAAQPARRASGALEEIRVKHPSLRRMQRGFLGAVLAATDKPTTRPITVPERRAFTGQVFNINKPIRAEVCLPPNWKPQGASIDVLVHFHGEPWIVQQNFEESGLKCVLITVNYGGASSRYRALFEDPEFFDNLLDEALEKLKKEQAVPAEAQWGRLALSSFSSGYGAVREILLNAKYFNMTEAVVLADSLHSDFADSPTSPTRGVNPAQLIAFTEYARLAADGRRTFLLTRSSILPETYAGTPETAAYLIHALGGAETPVVPPEDGPNGFLLISRFDKGNFHMRGYAGIGPADQINHLYTIGTLFRQISFGPQSGAAPAASAPASVSASVPAQGQAPASAPAGASASPTPAAARDRSGAPAPTPRVIRRRPRVR